MSDCGPTPALAQGRGFVTDQYDGKVSVFDLATLQPVKRITVGDYPEGIEATADGRRRGRELEQYAERDRCRRAEGRRRGQGGRWAEGVWRVPAKNGVNRKMCIMGLPARKAHRRVCK